MARTIAQVIADLDRIIEALPDLIVKHTEQGALGALALVDLRITEKGIDRTGSPFRPYTPQYAKRKTKLKRNRGIVDFQLTGQMLASTATGFERIGPTSKQVNGGNVKIQFDGRDKLTRDKLQGNNKSRPGFLEPSVSEMKMVNTAANEGLEEDIRALI